MIAWLKGRLTDIERNFIVIDVNGVGYQVFVSPSHVSQLPLPGHEIEMVIHTDVKETDITLYGFRNTMDRKIFLFLKKVKGIGSKLAISILSSIETRNLLLAIATSDIAVLTKVPGVGKKSAERIILELKEQVQSFVKESSINDSITIERDIHSLNEEMRNSLFSDRAIQDASMALIALGFNEDAVATALNTVLNDNSSEYLDNDPGEIVKKALLYIL
jgi:holliday junction DNA helicase RuvA